MSEVKSDKLIKVCSLVMVTAEMISECAASVVHAMDMRGGCWPVAVAKAGTSVTLWIDAIAGL